jgi:adenylate cyclase
MDNEIEHKFLVKGPYKSYAKSFAHIVQGYISTDVARTVRVRIYGEKAFLTIKGPSSADGLQRFQFEKEISIAEAQQLLSLCEPGIIDKNRYLVNCGDHTCEVDEFFGENEGLVMAEIEVNSPNEVFQKPSFLGKEVTGDKRFYNSQLRLHPFKEWCSDLKI